MRLHQIRAPCDSRNDLTRRLRRPKSRPYSTRALLQLVAIDDCTRIARHIVEDAALDKRVYAGVTEQDQRRTIIIAARIARDFPSLREQLVDRQRCLRCRQARRCQHRCPRQHDQARTSHVLKLLPCAPLLFGPPPRMAREGRELPGPLVAPAPPRYYQVGGRLKCIIGVLVLLGQLAVKTSGASALFSMMKLESLV